MNMQQPFLVPWVGLAAAPTAVAGNPTNGGAQSPTLASQYNTSMQPQMNGALTAGAPQVSTTTHLQKMIALQQQQQQQVQHQNNATAAQAAAQIAAVNACLQQPMGANSAGVPQQTTQIAAQQPPQQHPHQQPQQPSINPSVSAATANQIQAQINAAHQQYNAAALAANAAATQQAAAATMVSLPSICQPIGQTYPSSAVYQTAPMGGGQMSTIGAALSNAAAMGVNGLIPNVPAAFAAAAAAAANSQAVAQAAACAGGNPYALGVSPHHPSMQKLLIPATKDGSLLAATAAAATINGYTPLSTTKISEKRKIIEEIALSDVKKAKLETKALKAKRPGFTDDRYKETAYYVENGLRKVYPYYFTFTTFTKGRWVGEKILEVFGREFRAHPVEEYERCIMDGTLTVNYEQVDVDYRLRHNDLLANIVHRHETPVLSKPIDVIHLSEDLVVLDKPCSLPVHPCGRYRHNTVVFILAKEYHLKNLRTIHRLDRLTSGLLMFGRNPKKARDMEQQIRNRQVLKEYVCRVEGEFPEGLTQCTQPVEVVSYKIGVCKVSPQGKECKTEFERLSFNGTTSVVLCRPFTGRMHQIRVHLQYLGFPVMNDPLYNHVVFGPSKGKGGHIGKSDDQLIQDLIAIHNAENWLGMDGDSELSMFNGKDGDNRKNSKESDRKSNGMIVDGNVEKDNEVRVETKTEVNGHHHSSFDFDPRNPMSSIENNPNVPKNCTITRPPPITRPGGEPIVLRQPLELDSNEPITDQDNELLAKFKEYRYGPEKMTWDPNCYECKVRYRDPKAKDLVMYLHAWRYKGPDWQFQTQLPEWARETTS